MTKASKVAPEDKLTETDKKSYNIYIKLDYVSCKNALIKLYSTHKGKFNSREYDKSERMELIDSPVRDAIRELKTYP